MKVYVDELPKKCEDCPFHKLDIYVDVYGYQTNSHECVLDGSMLTNSCPLQSFTDYTKQVRKEVVQEIRSKIEKAKLIYEWKGKEITIEDVLDQIQGVKNEQIIY